MKVTFRQKEVSPVILTALASALVLLMVALSLIFYFVGHNAKLTAEAINTKAESLKRIDSEYQASLKSLEETRTELGTAKSELETNTQIVNDMRNYNANREALDKEIADMTAKSDSLKIQIQSQQTELDRLTGAVTIAKTEKTLSAGVYMVGTDVEPGTYNVQLVSGSGNFFVRGNHSVNEIFGTSERFGYIKEYKNMKVSAGDEIEVKGGLTVKLLLK